MSKFALFSKLAQWAKKHRSELIDQVPGFRPTRKQLKRLRPPRYKPAFSMGYRGWPKTEVRCGGVPAPTMDQVRKKEREYGLRLHVKNGLLFFKSDGVMFTKHEAKKRTTWIFVDEIRTPLLRQEVQNA